MSELVFSISGLGTGGGEKKRLVTYSGCWTCRERHIRCDERPGRCARCEAAKIACAGYDVRLCWPSDRSGKSGRSSGRRRIPRAHVPYPTPPSRASFVLASPEPVLPSFGLALPSPGRLSSESASPRSDKQSPPTGRFAEPLCNVGRSSGPVSPIESLLFSTFSLAPRTAPRGTGSTKDAQRNEHYSARPSHAGSDETGHSLPDTAKCWAITDDELLPSQSMQDRDIIPEHLDDDVSQVCDLDDQDVSLSKDGCLDNEEAALARTSDAFYNNSSTGVNDDWEIESCSPRPVESTFLPSFRLMKPQDFTGSSATILLLRYYAEHLAPLMQPVLHRGNPFRYIYYSTAVEAHRALEESRVSSSASLASVAVYHSVLASAASYLQGACSENGSSIYRLACHHRKEALKAVRGALEGKNISCRLILTAMLALTSVDIISGGTNDHWMHLEAAMQLLQSRMRLRLVSPQTKLLGSMCRMLSLFSQTTRLDFTPISWPEDGLSPDLGLGDFPDCVEFIYGITPFLAKAILRTYHLSQYLAYYERPNIPSGLLEACESLHDDLISWSIESEPFSSFSSIEHQYLDVVKAQASSFYYALMIYHLRSVHNCPRSELRREQHATLKALHLAEDLKQSLSKQDYWAAPLTWPAFMASCEATGEDRQLWLAYWERLRAYRMVNFASQEALVHQIWASLDAEDELTDWRQALSRLHVRIIPV